MFKSANFVVHVAKVLSRNVNSHQKNVMARGLPKQKPIEGVKHIILVSSGKGGVGKTTVAVNLSTALKIVYPDKQVGLLDTDVFGPSVPLMMNLHDTPLLTNRNLMEPLVNYGVKCMSMGFLIDEGSPVIWRGLMVMQALDKLMRQVDWGEVDYLVVDTPPGTGDTHLSLVQNLPIAGTLLVTTPQTTSIQVTKRGGVMYKKLNIPIIGIIENMSYMECPNCTTDIRIFSEHATQKLSEELNVKILAKLPIYDNVPNNTDDGIPMVLNNESKYKEVFTSLAKSVVEFLNQNTPK